MIDNHYTVEKHHVKIDCWGNTTDGVALYEWEYPDGVDLYFVMIDGQKYERFLTLKLAKESAKGYNKRHNRIKELSNGKVLV